MIKNVFILFHFLTMVSAIVATIMFLIFFLQAQDSINLIVFFPALFVSAVMILNSYFMYHSQYRTGYFTAMQVITIIAGLFSVIAFLAVGKAFQGSLKEILITILTGPFFLLIQDPRAALIYGFPILAATTAITSFYIERP